MSSDGASAFVLIDSCAIDRFALLNIDPTRALVGSAFRLAMTPSLAREYRRALDHLFVPSYVKVVIRSLLRESEMLSEAEDMSATDDHLMALSKRAIVITDDAKQYRRRLDDHRGLLAWPDVEAHLRAGLPLAAMLARVDISTSRGAG